jgi:hypothetical protein
VVLILPPEERAAIDEMLEEMLRSSNPAYLVKMIEAYFSRKTCSPLEPFIRV